MKIIDIKTIQTDIDILEIIDEMIIYNDYMFLIKKLDNLSEWDTTNSEVAINIQCLLKDWGYEAYNRKCCLVFYNDIDSPKSYIDELHIDTFSTKKFYIRGNINNVYESLDYFIESYKLMLEIKNKHIKIANKLADEEYLKSINN